MLDKRATAIIRELRMEMYKRAAVAMAIVLGACVAVDAKCAPEGKMYKVGPALAPPVREGAWSRMRIFRCVRRLSSVRMTRPIPSPRMRVF